MALDLLLESGIGLLGLGMLVFLKWDSMLYLGLGLGFNCFILAMFVFWWCSG